MAGCVKRKGAGMNVGRQLNFRELPLQVCGYLSQMRNLFGRDHHEFAGRHVGCQRIIRKDDGIHAHGIAKDGPLPL